MKPHSGNTPTQDYKLEVKYVPVQSLIPYARNARTHSPAQISQIAGSMREFGWTNPVLVDGERGIIAGHGRVLAAQQLGIAEVPVIELAHLTEAQRRAYVIADNKLALNAGWDPEMLKLELCELSDHGFNLVLTGFDLGEIEAMTVGPLFEPTSADEQGRLDEKKKACCPSCGHEFTP